MGQGNGICGILGAGAVVFGLTLASPAVLNAQGGNSAKRQRPIHIVGLDSARAAKLVACRELQAYGQEVAAGKLKALREQGVLANTMDSLSAEMQRTRQSKEMLAGFLGLGTLPDSLQSAAGKAGPSCSAVPSQAVFQRLTQAEMNRLPKMGIGIGPLTRQAATAVGLSDTLGLLVTGVAPNSGAQAAGMVAGDVIVSVGDKPVTSLRQFREQSARWKDGDKVNVEVARKGGTRQKMSVVVRVKS